MSAKANSIQVCIKVRPCELGQSSLWQVKEGRSIQLMDSHAEPSVFDYVFDEGAGNQEVFDRMAQHIVRACMQGFNGTIFAYGQTSSGEYLYSPSLLLTDTDRRSTTLCAGKTYTMMGDGQNPGVMVLAAKEIFQQIANEKERDFLLRVGYIEIYNEKIYDLLNKKNQDLKIHEAGNGIVNVNCEECIITSEDDLLRLLSLGNKERTVGETNMNERSSRSHAIFRIIIESKKSGRTDDDAVIQSVLNLVDLAGSERADQTGATGARLKEGAHINKSLMFLSNVIKNLSENMDNKFISFRDSKLTRILQASLGGNAFTSIICTIKPSIMEESMSTLNFAMRAKKIRIKPQVNEMVSDATMMKRLEREIKTLKSQLAEEKRKKESQLTVQDLERRLKTDMLKIISSTSLSDQRQQKRRRTWCPVPTGGVADATLTMPANESRLLRPSNLSNLPKPTFFANSNIAYREIAVPKTVNILSSLDITTDNDSVINEKFVPAESVNFDTPPQLWPQKAKPKSRKLPDLALTPLPNPMGPETVEKIKKEIEELQTFTSLEKHFDVEWDSLRENLDKVTAQRDQLEQDCVSKAERCEAMQAEVSTLTIATEAANSKIVEYEKEIQALKQTIAKMDLENREAISLEFQFEAYKKKSSLREQDLLSALSDKELAIQNLQKSLDELSRDMVRNSKEALMRSMCPNLADFGETTLNEGDAKKVDCECDRLRAEIVATEAKLEKIQSDFDVAVSEASQKKEECQRLSAEISKAQEDFATMQNKYDAQQGAIETMEADFQAIQQKYHKLQEEYESLGRTSGASDDQCQQLQAENTRLQLEIKDLKERVEEAQRKLMEATSHVALAEELKAKNNELKAKLTEMMSNFHTIQEEYDNLSSQLMESVQENDALRNELKQRPLPNYDLESMRSSGVDSMKSSGVETEFGEPEQQSNHLLEQFAVLSESIHQIELKNHSGLSRFFRVSKPEKDQEQENNVTALKLCLESAKYIECETHEANASEGTHLKGVLKQQMFQFVALSQEQLELAEDRRLLNIISQLEQEIKDKNELMEATEATINEMREQMTNLESELMEKSVIVNKVEGYQRQIESLEKQNAEMTMVYEELQDKVHRNSTMSESLVHLMPNDDTISCANEDASFRASLEELQTKVSELQAEVENQLKQMQVKDKNIAELKAEIEEMGERCLSSEVKLVEVENDVREKQQLLDRQSQKLSNDALLIDQLQEKNAKLQELNIKTEQEQTIPSSEYEKQIEDLRQSLSRVQDELVTLEKLKTDEINSLQLEYMVKMERSETENRAKFREYTKELEDCREQYENEMGTLKEQLLQAEEELSGLKDRCQAKPEESEDQEKLIEAVAKANQQRVELEAITDSLKEKLVEAEAKADQQRVELETITDSLKEKLAEAEAKADLQRVELEANTENLKEKLAEAEAKANQQRVELEAITESLKEQLAEAEAKADQQRVEIKAITVCLKEKLAEVETELRVTSETLKVKLAEADAQTAQQQAKLEAITQTLNEKLAEAEEKQAIINDITCQRDASEAAVAEQKSALDKLKLENQQLLEQLQMIAKAGNEEYIEQIASFNKKIEELTAMCDQQALELNNLRQEKINLQAEINEANVLYLSTKNSLQKLELKMNAESQKQLMSEKEFNEQCKAFNAKISELGEALESCQLNAVSHDDLVLKHKELIASSNAKIQELQEKYEQQLRDIDTLGKEKAVLQSKIDEADAQHSSTLKKLHDLEMQTDDLSRQRLTEKSDLEEKLETMTAKIEDLKTELQSARIKAAGLDGLISEHENLKLSLTQATAVSSTLQEEVDSLQAQLLASEREISSRDLEKAQLGSQLKLALEEKDAASAEQLALTTQLQAVEEKMASQAGKFEKELADLNSSMNELQLKLKSLQERKDNLESENDELKVKLRNAHNLRSQLEEEQKLCATLRTQFTELKASKTQLEEQLANKEAEVNRKLLEMSHQVELGAKECDKLRCDLSEKEVLNSTMSTLSKEKQLLEEKISSFNQNDNRNAELNAKLRAKEAELKSLREASINQKLVADEANIKCRQFMEQKVELTNEIEKLRTTLKSKEAGILMERESMNATISSLLEDKRNLEEKQCVLNDIVCKLEAELSTLQALKTNSSFESNTSSGSAPRKSLDRNPAASLPRKSSGFESEMRRSRRLSAYDEHRRQSYWNDVRDCGTMTDPVDNNCNCKELDSKLQACQQELFIRESQVTALNMELKHHPLKDENAQLKKRVLEEQEKARSEQKRLKMKIQDLNAKVSDLSNAAKLAPAPVAVPNPSLVPPSASVHTQTECQDAQLEKKYQDALVLLRSRYHLIKDLEEKLKQNENTDTSNVTSLTSGKINSLTKQCETLKKELGAVREKYETSKRVLLMRKDEMVKMRDRLAAFESAAAAAPK
ncbi:hypothetical protein KR032_006980 [Drosophila birchii]|nr:hypothetical protein KR032_006980 [Drosophila birchii]